MSPEPLYADDSLAEIDRCKNELILKDEVIESSLPEDQKYDVLWGNSARLFKLDGASPHSW